MVKQILVLDKNQEQCRDLCELLGKSHYPATPMHSIRNLQDHLEEKKCLAVIVDIDTVPINNRTIRDLTLRFPGVYFFCLSEQPFHPELKDAICYHIYACLNKPVDQDELFYFLRSIYENETDPKNQFAG
jgi:DNA-binding NtrC family response regulator